VTAASLGVMFLDFLEGIGCGGLLIDAASFAVSLNSTAHRILQANSGLRFHREDAAQARQSLELMLDCDVRRLREERSFVVQRKDERWPIMVSIAAPREARAGAIAVVMLDLNLQSPLDALSVQKAFGLTAAESALAIGIARGATLTEISRSQGVSMNTVRGHLTSTFAKTHTRRQAELSALLARFSLISS
jgi:DNA-binding CsgD family transcriptional regulator